jgi:hypothetical protein
MGSVNKQTHEVEETHTEERRAERSTVNRKIPFLIMILALLLACASSKSSSKGNEVKLCKIEIPHELQDATFTLVYRFETTRQGKLIHITKIKNDFLPDAPFQACMEQWRLPSISGQGAAEFSRTPTEGWTEIRVSGRGFDLTISYH